MKRSPLKPSPHYIERRRRAAMQRSKPLRKRGKKGRAWERTRRQLNEEYLAIGLTCCELRLPGCTPTENLTHAHLYKRRNLDSAGLKITVLACMNCHNKVEMLGEAKMSVILTEVYNRRDEYLMQIF